MNGNDLARARRRYVWLLSVRAGGVLAMVLGIVVWKSDLFAAGGLPRVGLPLFVIGFAASMLVPVLLARAWRTPPPS